MGTLDPMIDGAPSGTETAEWRPLVAVVDDDSAFVGYVRTFLDVRGYEARTYTRGDEILAAIGQGRPPDIVLLDVTMPGMDGLRTLKALKTVRPALQVVMLSGQEQAPLIVEALRLGAADYVVKPGDPEGLGEIALESAINQAIERLRLMNEVSDLRRLLNDEQKQAFLGWGESPAMRLVAHVIEQVADSDVSVLIRGESGVGKELVARAIHQHSTRKQKPFVKVNCAALPADLLESELFGHEKGAFTGASMTRVGKFEQANFGTIFLDEIGELKPALQAKMLHVLQDAEFTKLGGNRAIEVDVRVVTATNRDLETMLASGEFREDLYYRLKVIETVVPPLRERRDEIPQLTEFFIAKYAEHYKRPVRPLSAAVHARFLQYEWPGNIRQLENMIKRFVILQDEELLERELGEAPSAGAMLGESSADVGPPPHETPMPLPMSDAAVRENAGESPGAEPEKAVGRESYRLVDVAREAALEAGRPMIEDALQQMRWNRRKAAVLLGISYKTLLNRIKQSGIQQP